MTREEAIETLKANYPSACYEQLREAVDTAIEALKAQDAASDTISRQAAIDAVRKNTFRLTFAEEQNCEGHVAWSAEAVYSEVMEGALLELPSAQPEITDGQAVEHLQASGWMQNHDKQMYEMVLRERLADDSDSYDALLPSAQPERKWIPCSQELPPVGTDVILTFHTHPDWPKLRVKPAWRCNVEDVIPDGQWAIEGRLGNFVVKIEDGIAWMPLPEPWKGETS